eukprot:5779357-Alexandrium_andersonii.AAC.1
MPRLRRAWCRKRPVARERAPEARGPRGANMRRVLLLPPSSGASTPLQTTCPGRESTGAEGGSGFRSNRGSRPRQPRGRLRQREAALRNPRNPSGPN